MPACEKAAKRDAPQPSTEQPAAETGVPPYGPAGISKALRGLLTLSAADPEFIFRDVPGLIQVVKMQEGLGPELRQSILEALNFLDDPNNRGQIAEMQENIDLEIAKQRANPELFLESLRQKRGIL